MSNIIQVSTGGQHTCALSSNGQVSCWGDNINRQVGHPRAPNRETRYPRLVRLSSDGPPLDGIIQISAGLRHTCALNSRGNVYCWGSNYSGELGIGSRGDINGGEVYPIWVRDETGAADIALSDITYIASGGNKTCALKSNGVPYCWGIRPLAISNVNRYVNGYYGLYPLVTVLEDIVKIEQADNYLYPYTCGLRSNRTVSCWGRSDYGQLTRGQVFEGYVYPISHSSPRRIRATLDSATTLRGVIEMSLAGYYNCGLMETGGVKCWGRTSNLGRGSKEDNGNQRYILYPVDVLADSSTPFVPGVGMTYYACREGFSRCVISSISVSAGDGQSNPSNASSPVIRVTGINAGETVTFYSDENCSTAFVGGEVTGDSEFNTEMLTLSNAIQDGQQLTPSYKVTGSAIDSSHCFKSHLIFDRMPPSNPTISMAPAFDLNPTATIGNVAERGKVRVYFEDSTCSDGNKLLREQIYYGVGTIEIATEPTYEWTVAEEVPEAFRFYVVVEDMAENLSECVASTDHYVLNPGRH